MPRVSVVIVTANRYEDLKNCLESLKKQSFKDFEIVVVCKKLNDEMREIQRKYEGKFVEQTGIGMSNARNDGIRLSKSQIVTFIDDDAVADANWLEEILKTFEWDTSIGGVGGKVYTPRLEEHALRVARSWKLPKLLIRKYRQIIAEYLIEKMSGNVRNVGSMREAKVIIGTNMSFRRKVLEEVHGFDENFYGISYYEEGDLCYRIRKLGYRLIWNPDVVVLHNTQPRVTASKDLFQYVDNQVYFIVKNQVLQGSLDWLRYFLSLIGWAFGQPGSAAYKLSAFRYCVKGLFMGRARGLKSRRLRSFDSM